MIQIVPEFFWNHFKGIDPFSGGDFFIYGPILMKFAHNMQNWIRTLFCSWIFLDFGMVSKKFWIFFLCYFQNNRSQKLSMLEEKYSFEICIEFRTKWHKAIFNFCLTYFFDFFFFWYFLRYAFLDLWPAIKNLGLKIEKSLYVTLCRIQCRFQNCLCFSSSIDSFSLLFYWRMKNTFYERGKYIYIYIYIAIYINIYAYIEYCYGVLKL